MLWLVASAVSRGTDYVEGCIASETDFYSNAQMPAPSRHAVGR
jgi:hypothetical protein